MANSLNKYCLYRHTSPIGRVYIGITSLKPERRWGKHGQRYKDNTYFKHAILKYGWDNFNHEVLFTNLSEERAKYLEIELIRHYKALGICYNISAGGDGCSRPTPEEVKRKISISSKGRKSYERDAEWRRNRSKFMKEHPVLTDEIRNKAHISSAKILSKPVLQIQNGQVIATYRSAREASRITGYDYSYIAKCCKGLYKDAYGYTWKYLYVQNKK